MAANRIGVTAGTHTPPCLSHSASRVVWYIFPTVLLAVVGGCADITTPGAETLTFDELLILPLKSDAPTPPQESFYIVNSRTSVIPIVHPDPFNTRYLEARFPADCISTVGGQPVGPADSVLATVRPRAGSYGFTLSPGNLGFSSTCGATATLSFGRYGDLSVPDGSSTYLDRAAYAAALDLWWEVGSDRWRVVPGSASSGSDAVGGEVEQTGSFVLAAPR